MGWLVSTAGAVIVAVVLRDIFHTLWRPQGFGSLTHGVVGAVWRSSKAITRQRGSELAGPLGILATVAVWTLLNIVGWALIYLPWMPADFYFGTSLEPGLASEVVSSLYFSTVTLATLGFGDVTPVAPALRLAVRSSRPSGRRTHLESSRAEIPAWAHSCSTPWPYRSRVSPWTSPRTPSATTSGSAGTACPCRPTCLSSSHWSRLLDARPIRKCATRALFSHERPTGWLNDWGLCGWPPGRSVDRGHLRGLRTRPLPRTRRTGLTKSLCVNARHRLR